MSARLGSSATEQAHREIVGKLLGWGVRTRVALAPFIFGIFALVAWASGRPLHASVIACLGAFLAAWSVYEVRKYGSGQLLRVRTATFGVLMFAPHAMVLVTGGLQSPFTVALLPACVIAPLAAPRLARAGTVVQIVLVCVYALLDVAHAPSVPALSLLGGPLHPEQPVARTIAHAFILCFASAMGNRLGSAIAGAFSETFERLAAARDETLASYAQQSATLTALSAEIAHELKNPLASIKGLGALVARDVDGKTAERVAVLRREVDRVQTILDELLVFARPVVPLSLGEVDLGSLVCEVAALHEGVAAERSVRIEIDARDAPQARCDGRKVKQVLVNLVQNAVAASPNGETVTIAATREGAIARLLVRDRGGGIAHELRDRIFEAGVTSRHDGSGLGLTIARTLAQQHGGEVTLREPEGGGCEAELRLPIDGPVVSPMGAEVAA